MDHDDFSRLTVEDIARLRRRIVQSGIPSKKMDQNLIIGTWNIRNFGQIHHNWDENTGSPKRNLRSLALIAEIIQYFDVIAIQEVKSDTSGIRYLLSEFLGPSWGIILSDVTAGPKGNTERMAFLYDTRRVAPSGLAGEIVLPPDENGDPAAQFDRTPYIVGFRSNTEQFALLTAHIRYGNLPGDRIDELRKIASYTADEIKTRAKINQEESNLIVLGDFNIDDRKENLLFQAFTSSGLVVPPELLNMRTTFGTKPKYYDQIAWFMGDLDLIYNDRAGVIDFSGAVFKEISMVQMSYRVSDHFPLWIEFIVDRSTEKMAHKLGVDPAMPDPLSIVPD